AKRGFRVLSSSGACARLIGLTCQSYDLFFLCLFLFVVRRFAPDWLTVHRFLQRRRGEVTKNVKLSCDAREVDGKNIPGSLVGLCPKEPGANFRTGWTQGLWICAVGIPATIVFLAHKDATTVCPPPLSDIS